jgi:hypothetical protein
VARAVLGDLAGPVEDVGVEHGPDPRPVRSERQLPVGLDLFRHPDQAGLRLGVQGPQPGAVVCVQNPYGIGAPPEQDHFLRTCGEQGVAFVPFYAIAGAGRQAGATGTDSDQLLAVARAHGATPAQVRLAWTLRRGPHVLAIPGTGNPDHLLANVAAGALRLSEDDLAVLSACGGLAEHAAVIRSIAD